MLTDTVLCMIATPVGYRDITDIRNDCLWKAAWLVWLSCWVKCKDRFWLKILDRRHCWLTYDWAVSGMSWFLNRFAFQFANSRRMIHRFAMITAQLRTTLRLCCWLHCCEQHRQVRRSYTKHWSRPYASHRTVASISILVKSLFSDVALHNNTSQKK